MNTSMPAAQSGRPPALRASAGPTPTASGDVLRAGFDFQQLLRERSTSKAEANATDRRPASSPLQAWVGQAPMIRLSDRPVPALRPSGAECTGGVLADHGDPEGSTSDLTAGGDPRIDNGRRGKRSGTDSGRDTGDDAGLQDGNNVTQRFDLFLVPDTRFDAAAVTARPGARGDGPGSLDATRAALEAALTNPVIPLESDAAAKWEVTIPQALGQSLELQACRAQQTAGSAPAWTLDIRSSRDMSSALARTASRLSDRLEARSLRSRIRVERSDDDEAQ